MRRREFLRIMSISESLLMLSPILNTRILDTKQSIDASPGDYDILELPRGFLFGISISGFQYEMGLPITPPDSIDPNTDWYAWVHDETNRSTHIVSGDLPEYGIGYWSLYSTDHQWAHWLGLNAWRLNIEWSRIFPRPTTEVKVYVATDSEGGITSVEVNEDALRGLDSLANRGALSHYVDMIRDAKSRGLEVFLALNHFTLPIWIHDPIRARNSALTQGPLGWLDGRTVVEFAKYAAYIAWKLGDLVDNWVTINEPLSVTMLGYVLANSGFPPGVPSIDAFIKATVNMMQAHARAYDLIKAFAHRPKIGIIMISQLAQPATATDTEAAKDADYVFNEWFMKGVHYGVLDDQLDGGGYFRKDMRGKLDWVGVNYYTRLVVKQTVPPDPRHPKPDFLPVPGYGPLCQPNSYSLDGRPTSDFGWEVYPEGFREVLRRYSRFGLPIYVTENGISDEFDRWRPAFLVAHLLELRRALSNVDVRGYFHWSLVDNYEWAQGFRQHFGLLSVDLSSKVRYIRPSAYVYRDVATHNGVPEYLTALTNLLTPRGTSSQLGTEPVVEAITVSNKPYPQPKEYIQGALEGLGSVIKSIRGRLPIPS